MRTGGRVFGIACFAGVVLASCAVPALGAPASSWGGPTSSGAPSTSAEIARRQAPAPAPLAASVKATAVAAVLKTSQRPSFSPGGALSAAQPSDGNGDYLATNGAITSAGTGANSYIDLPVSTAFVVVALHVTSGQIYVLDVAMSKAEPVAYGVFPTGVSGTAPVQSGHALVVVQVASGTILTLSCPSGDCTISSVEISPVQ